MKDPGGNSFRRPEKHDPATRYSPHRVALAYGLDSGYPDQPESH